MMDQATQNNTQGFQAMISDLIKFGTQLCQELEADEEQMKVLGEEFYGLPVNERSLATY